LRRRRAGSGQPRTGDFRAKRMYLIGEVAILLFELVQALQN
jgi:hypothetical protein